MKSMLKKLPIPISGLMLGMASLGNLLVDYSENLRYLSFSISLIIFLLLILKLIIYPTDFKEGFNNPSIAGILVTAAMYISTLSTYIVTFSKNIAIGTLFFGIIVHIFIILFFTKKHILNFNIMNIVPSIFVVYIGIALNTVFLSNFSKNKIALIVFVFSLISYLILMPLIYYRVFMIKKLPEILLPTVAIITAPSSLITLGYLSTFSKKNINIVYALTILILLNLGIALYYIVRNIGKKFVPTISAFTFPIIITTVSLKALNNFFKNSNSNIELNNLINTMFILSSFLVVIVFLKYIVFLSSNSKVSK